MPACRWLCLEGGAVGHASMLLHKGKVCRPVKA